MTREQEATIIKQVLEGDVNAFEGLVKEYEKNVYNLALRMTGDPEDAADMAQDAFIKAYSSLSSFRGDSKFSVWLFRIVSNLCLDFLRSRKRRPTVSLSVENDEGEDMEFEIADESQSPETLLEQKLTREAVRCGLDSLPPEQRHIFRRNAALCALLTGAQAALRQTGHSGADHRLDTGKGNDARPGAQCALGCQQGSAPVKGAARHRQHTAKGALMALPGAGRDALPDKFFGNFHSHRCTSRERF